MMVLFSLFSLFVSRQFYIMIQVAVLYHIPRLEGLIKQAIQQINLTF